MNLQKILYLLFPLSVTISIISCGDAGKPPEKDVVKTPQQLSDRTSENLQKLLSYASENKEKINDSTTLKELSLIRSVYEKNNFKTIWSYEDHWHAIADSLYDVLAKVEEYGLFPSDYYYDALSAIRNKFQQDSTSRKDAALWARADVLLTESYFNLAKELKIGRLERDSLTLRDDSLLTDNYFIEHFDTAVADGRIITSLHELEPHYVNYEAIKAGIKNFLEADSFRVKYQDSALEKFKRIALTLDRYKLLPDSLPKAHVWVNIPAYYLDVREQDTSVFKSKVIVGNPKTRTPELTSAITNFITYPQWTVPYSIIFKEMLPQIKKNVGYLNKQNLMVVDKNDSVIDPHTINWNKMSKGHFPYLLRQRQGDDNSLGVMKFNFRNKYSVYLHDTNARSLFSRTNRALSHGCVRVEKWQDLAHFLVRNDSIRYNIDTLKAWITRHEKHTVTAFPRVPIYIRYYTVEGKEDGSLKFYSDIYKEDSALTAKYFAGRKL